MKRLALVLTLLCLLALGGQAFAELCTLDAVPAAPLLLPYFAVDLGAAPGTGVDTLFSINNASAAPTIAHVAVWSDWTQPVLDFDVFLTGYDVQSVSLYQVFVNGNLPVTADEQSDGDDTISPSGDGSGVGGPDCLGPDPDSDDWDCSFDGSAIAVAGVSDCIDIFPFFTNPLLTGQRLADIQDKLTGVEIDGGCFGADHGDDTARGYITIDNANACSLIFPNDPLYFGDGVNPGVASNANQLWGDWYIVDQTNNFAQGDNLVAIEADDDFDGGDSGYTYYARYSGLLDRREPLATTWGARYLNGGAFDQTSLTVWRDSTSADIDGAGYVCGAPGTIGTGPSWHPMNETQVVAFNEAEQFQVLCAPTTTGGGPPVSPPDVPIEDDPVCFPLETQNVNFGDAPLGPLTYNFGWVYLNLNVGIDDPVLDFDPDPETLAASWVIANHSALGAYSVGMPAVQLTSACTNADVSIDLP